MILSNLVKDDPRGFVDLDRNLGRHIGKENVETFHEEAGELVINAMTDDPNVFNALMSDKAVVAELNTALRAVDNRAFGRPAGSTPKAKANALRDELKAGGIANEGVTRSLVHAELLTNGVINDRTMRNPKIMAILETRVRQLFESKRR